MPTANAITAALSSATRKLFKRDPENVTVNLVREAAADELGVDPNFFKNGEWKGKSKDFIRGEVVCSFTFAGVLYSSIETGVEC
jgi:hypothetical protein